MYASFVARWRARGDHSPLTAPRQPLRSFYIESAPHEIEHLAVIARVFALVLRLCFETLLVSPGALHLVSAGTHVSSLPALCSHCSRLCWRSASCLPLFSSGLCCRLCSLLCSASVSSRLGYASHSSCGPLHVFCIVPALFGFGDLACAISLLQLKLSREQT